MLSTTTSLTVLAVSFRALRSLRTMVPLHRKDREYEAVILTLNKLQTNAAALAVIRERKDNRQVSEPKKMQQYLLRVGLTAADLQQLNAIHVSGTKGKGSVCAMTESILRSHGFKTGLFVSPHLLEVRERIRINGQPLSRARFVSYFWDVYRKLDNSRHFHGDSMPSYFELLTVMAFSVFLENQVDVAVVEVGIGGTHDSTNIIEHPVVCGVASLGYDHTDVLGSTLSDIAWHKGGICKEGCPALTVVQPPEALVALACRASELAARSLHVVPPLTSYPGPLPELSLRGNHQHCNASLAVQLCHTWLQKRFAPSSSSPTSPVSGETVSERTVPTAQPFALTEKFRDGLRLCKWAGRNQVVQQGNVTYYLDGAHTPQSMEASAQWFLSEIKIETSEPTLRVLLFNTTGCRDSQTFLLPFVVCGFHHVVFCPNIAHSMDSAGCNSADQTNLMVIHEHQLARCYTNQQSFREVVLSTNLTPATESREQGGSAVTPTTESREQGGSAVTPATESREQGGSAVNSGTVESSCGTEDPVTVEGIQTRVLVSVSDAIQFVESLSPAKVAVLVTGSLHLVGTTMSVLNFTVDDV